MYLDQLGKGNTSLLAPKRLFDLVLACVALLITAPLLGLAALGIPLASPGPVLYRARRMGRRGKPFVMYKLRTMHANAEAVGARITAHRDPRIFPLGVWLRRLKIDELPQLVNIIKGDMSIVGPRPEDVAIVEQHYAPEHWAVLEVRPGLTSPASIYEYIQGSRLLNGPDPMTVYLEQLMPIKLALDTIYIQDVSFSYDLKLMLRTFRTIASVSAGKAEYAEPPEMEQARLLVRPAVGLPRNT